jgi:hypothetical protein
VWAALVETATLVDTAASATSTAAAPSEAHLEALATTLLVPFGPGLLALAFVLDMRWGMNPSERERAWHPAHFGNAVALAMLGGPLGFLCLPLHVLRTRRGWRRVVLPWLYFAGYLVALVGAAFFVDGIVSALG